MVTSYGKRTREEVRDLILTASASETGAASLRAVGAESTAPLREIRALPILDRTDHH